MKITPIDIIKGMSGKVCQHSDTYVSLNSTSGKMFTGKVCHPYNGPKTQKQLDQQQAFKLRSAQITAWLNANKPSAANGVQGTALYQQAQRLKKQLQKSNVRQVISLYMDASGNVNLPAVASTSTNGSATPVTPSGNGGTTSGGGNSTPSGNGGTTPVTPSDNGGSTSGGDNTGGDEMFS